MLNAKISRSAFNRWVGYARTFAKWANIDSDDEDYEDIKSAAEEARSELFEQTYRHYPSGGWSIVYVQSLAYDTIKGGACCGCSDEQIAAALTALGFEIVDR